MSHGYNSAYIIVEVRDNCGRKELKFSLAFITCILASLIAQLVKTLPAMQEIPVRFLGWEDLYFWTYLVAQLVKNLPAYLEGIIEESAHRERLGR